MSHSEFLRLPVIIVQDRKKLLIAGLPDLLAHINPVESKGFGVRVATGEVLEGHSAEANLRLLEKSSAPTTQVVQLRQD